MANPPPADTVDMKSSANGLPVDYWQSLVQYAEEEREEPPLGHMSWLQRMNLTHLLNEIVRIKGNVQHNRTTSADQMECIREKLHQYGKPSCTRTMSRDHLLADMN
jgi:hypothetical protein